jgi:cytochrome c nitrite reductase small subunit
MEQLRRGGIFHSLERRGSATVLLVGLLSGVLLGLGVFTFGYARGGSYLTDDPGACANCHVMRAQYAGWLKSSHGKWAVCNDCHAPDGAAKYGTKALNGAMHSWAFTTGLFPDEIRITGRNYGVADKACMKCHSEYVSGLNQARHSGSELSCIRCHSRVGHEK